MRTGRDGSGTCTRGMPELAYRESRVDRIITRNQPETITDIEKGVQSRCEADLAYKEPKLDQV